MDLPITFKDSYSTFRCSPYIEHLRLFTMNKHCQIHGPHEEMFRATISNDPQDAFHPKCLSMEVLCYSCKQGSHLLPCNFELTRRLITVEKEKSKEKVTWKSKDCGERRNGDK